MKHYRKFEIELEIPEWLDQEEIKNAIQDSLILCIKETELPDGVLRWHIAEID